MNGIVGAVSSGLDTYYSSVYAGIGGIFGIFLARWIATQDVSNLYPTGLFTLCSFLMSIGTLSFLKAYYVKKYHLTADTDTK